MKSIAIITVCFTLAFTMTYILGSVLSGDWSVAGWETESKFWWVVFSLILGQLLYESATREE